MLLDLVDGVPQDEAPLQRKEEGGGELEPHYCKEENPFLGVLRSKGFCWFAEKDDAVVYWSQAGRQFGISAAAGKWRSACCAGSLRTEARQAEEEEEEWRGDKDCVTKEEFGNRRQEIVFIGANIDQEVITEALDKCLL